MADRKTALGDIIGTTKERLEEQSPMADTLKALVDSTPVGKPTTPKNSQPVSTSSHHLTNYFTQVGTEEEVAAKRRPDKGPPRSHHMSMRLTPDERKRLNHWCDTRNLSLPDGIMALLEIAERHPE